MLSVSHSPMVRYVSVCCATCEAFPGGGRANDMTTYSVMLCTGPGGTGVLGTGSHYG